MTCEAKTPTAARERRGYLRRACAVMLACVLCFCLVRPPRAQAVVAETAGLVAAGAVALTPIGATVCLLVLAAVGVTFVQGFIEAENGVPFYGSRAYDAGYQLHQYLQSDEVSESVRSWSSSIVAQYEAEGKMLVGDSFTVPAEVAEVARQWAVQHFDFSDGSIVVAQQGLFSAGNSIVFSVPDDTSLKRWHSPVSLGSLYRATTADIVFDFKFADSVEIIKYDFETYWTVNGSKRSAIYHTDGVFTDPSVFYGVFSTWTATSGVNKGKTFLACGWYNIVTGKLWIDGVASSYPLSVESIPLTMTGTEALTVPISETKEITIPEMPLTDVDTDAGVVTIPVVGTLTAEDVLTGATDVPIDPPIVGDKTMVGDVALEDVATAQGDLGAIFIQKFPFCIPWDLAKAVGLLAAPPKTPYWEVDFMAPISGRVGGWRGDTSITIDMADYEIIGTVCRWTSTIMFCFALIGATKRLIWTA